MDAKRFLEESGKAGRWDSSGEFARVDARRALPAVRFGNDGKWVHEFVNHALSIGADKFEIQDCGENLDETLGLYLRYNGASSSLAEARSSARSFVEGPPFSDPLAFALACARDSGARLGPFRFGLTHGVFVARCGEGCLALDLLTGVQSVSQPHQDGWTYSLTLDRHRPLFTYSFSGHPELSEVQKLSSKSPLVFKVKRETFD